MLLITVPVVAHRMFGFLHRVGTVWTREPTLSENPLFLRHRHGFEEEVVKPVDSGIDEALLKPARYVAPGTRRSVNEIRDLFDGAGRADTTGELSVNQIWETAAITFRLVAIVDHAIRTDHAVLMGEVTPYARKLNQAGVVNFFFVRALDGAAGVGRPTPWPNDAAKKPGYAAMEDWEEIGTTWQEVVWIAGHELGHLLSLPHEGGTDNLMTPWITASSQEFRPVQVAVARHYAMRYYEAARTLSMLSTSFRKVFSDEAAEPLRMIGSTGAHWRFGETQDDDS